jgi:SAM-dependent methyltransferase
MTPDRQDTSLFWESLASDTTKSDAESIGSPLHSFISSLDFAQEARVILDAGCGYGRFSVPLAAKHDRIIALDLSKSMLERLRKNMEVFRLSNVDVIRGDLRVLPIRRGCLDGVVCYSTLCYIPKSCWYAVISQFAYCLRKAGVLFVQFKKYRGMFRPGSLFGILYFGVYVVTRLQERYLDRYLSPLIYMFKLPGRVEYFTSSASVASLLRELFDELFVEESGVYINCRCERSRIPEKPTLLLA